MPALQACRQRGVTMKNPTLAAAAQDAQQAVSARP
jgi:hypothetical protein